MKTTTITATVDRDQIMAALRGMTVNDEAFDHRQWSIWDAETFEAVAKLIRAGYMATEPPPRKYLPWTMAGGPNECAHGYAEGIPCPDCDREASPR